MKTIAIVLSSLLIQPVFAHPSSIVHESPGIPEKVEIPQIPAYKPAKALPQPKSLYGTKKVETHHTGRVRVSKVTGDWVKQCRVWAKQAGIPLPDIAITIIDGESDCEPSAQNPKSSAYGIGQFLNGTWAGVGCVKTSDPVIQLKCMYKYVNSRYSGWQGAYNHKVSRGWY